MKQVNAEPKTNAASEMQALWSALEEASQVVKRAEALLAAARGEAQAEKTRAALYSAELSRERARADQWQAEAATEVARARRAMEGGLAIAAKYEELQQENERLMALLGEPVSAPQPPPKAPDEASPPKNKKLPNIFDPNEADIGDVTIEYDDPEQAERGKKNSA